MRVYKILLVEDDHILSGLLESFFVSEGFHVTTAYNGQEGFEKFSRDNFDFMLSDIVMPICNGVDLAKKVLASNKPVYVAMMSGFSNNSEFSELSLSKYWVGFFSKPFDEEVILSEFKKRIEESPSSN